jgi:protease-4
MLIQRWKCSGIPVWISVFLMSVCAVCGPSRAQLLSIEIVGTPTERATPMQMFQTDAPLTLREIVEGLLLVADSAELRGALIGLNNARLTPTQAEEIGRAILIARAAGKRVHVFAAAYDQPGLMLAAGSDDVLLQTGGVVMLPGLHAQEMYLADTLEWVGVKAQLIQVGEYKGANEMLTRSGPSEAWDENIKGLLDGLYAEVRRPFEIERGMSEADTDAAFQQGWGLTGQEAIDLGIVDSLLDYASLGEFLAEQYGGPIGAMPAEDLLRAGMTPAEWIERMASVDADVPDSSDANDQELTIGGLLEQLGERFLAQHSRKVNDDPIIAIVHIDGPIVDGISPPSAEPGAAVGSSTIRQVLADLEANDQIAGVIVRINSPGGSALASEVMWQGVRRLVEKQIPVWASVGDMAASGGYYVAVGADRIYANPSSVLGSIGVVGGKITVGGLLDRGRIKVTERSRGPLGEMASSVEPWTESEAAMVESRISETYDLFVSRVTAGRPRADIDRIGAGRLFTGRQARTVGMIDSLGGLEDAVEDLSISLGLSDYQLEHYPTNESILDAVLSMVGGSGMPRMQSDDALERVLERTVRPVVEAAMGQDAWRQVRAAVVALAQIRSGGAVLASPRVLIFK